MNVEQALLFGKRKLKQYDIESYAIDATLLLMKAMSFTKVQIYTNNHVILTQKQQKEYLYDLEQRIQGKPIQYITGVCEFMGLPFTVQEGVLIPRADTEILVETVLQYHEKEHFQNAIDICTGTGCIAVSLAKYTDISMYGVDISERALQIAKKMHKIMLFLLHGFKVIYFKMCQYHWHILTALFPILLILQQKKYRHL